MTTEDGKHRVSPIGRRAALEGTIAGALADLELEAQGPKEDWPKKGGLYQGIGPGGWREDFTDDTGYIPDDCPVKPLGYEGETFYFIDTMGQVFSTGGKAMGVERMQILFAGTENFLYWAWPAFAKGGGVTGFKAEEARRDLYAACRARGPWSPSDMVRGRGAWLDAQGRLVLHCGEALYYDGKLQPTGELGEHFYPRRPRAAVPWAKPIETPEENPAVALFEVFNSWNFVRGNVDAFLLLGWLGVALLNGALEWRPSIFMVGDAGTGKSSLQNLIKLILGRAMVATTNATSAGLYQLMAHDALPIGIDEIEGDDGAEQSQQIIKMARDAASGSMRIRGGADHKGVEFMARSPFLFSAINPPPINKASLSRLAVLQLRQIPSGQKQPDAGEVDKIAPKLLRRVADHFPRFLELLEQYKEVLHQGGHSSRGQATFGTLLAAGHVLMGDAGMEAAGLPMESLSLWSTALAADTTPEVANSDPNWSRCIEAILTAPIDAFNKGERSTVGQTLDDLVNDERNNVDLHVARHRLASCGLGIVQHGLAFEGYGLAIPQAGKDVGKLLDGTSWAGRGSEGSWGWALNQGPEEIIRHKVPAVGAKNAGKLDNRMTIGGTRRRCIFVGLAELAKWQEGDGK